MNDSAVVRLVTAIVDAGGTLTVEGDRLTYRLPPTVNTPETVAALRSQKAVILAGLRAPNMHPAGGYTTAGRYLTPSGCLAPRACCRLGPCRRHRTGEPCRAETTGISREAA